MKLTKSLSVLLLTCFVFSAFAWECPECDGETTETAVLCASCGKVEVPSKNCPNCDTRVATTAKFCPECGFNFETNTFAAIDDEAPAEQIAPEQTPQKQTMGDFLLLPRLGLGTLGIQLGFNLGTDTFLGLDTTFAGSSSSSLSEFFFG